MTTTTQDRHTPEPWLAQHSQICKGSLAVSDCFRAEDGSPEANARRIVACVNACQGIPTENLEPGSFLEMNHADNAYVRQLTIQRDSLAEALRELVRVQVEGSIGELRRATDKARAALARLSK